MGCCFLSRITFRLVRVIINTMMTYVQMRAKGFIFFFRSAFLLLLIFSPVFRFLVARVYFSGGERGASLNVTRNASKPWQASRSVYLCVLPTCNLASLRLVRQI